MLSKFGEGYANTSIHLFICLFIYFKKPNLLDGDILRSVRWRNQNSDGVPESHYFSWKVIELMLQEPEAEMDGPVRCHLLQVCGWTWHL